MAKEKGNYSDSSYRQNALFFPSFLR